MSERAFLKGAPHLAIFEMWVPELRKTLGIAQRSKPTVILRKRRPSQSEGLPTKDLCILLSTAKTRSGAPHLAVFEMWVREAGKILGDQTASRHDPVMRGGHSCPPPLRLGLILGVIGFDPLHFDKGHGTRCVACKAGSVSAGGLDIRDPHLENREMWGTRFFILTRWSSASAQHACARSRSAWPRSTCGRLLRCARRR
jgi:hypothetical protein